VNNLTITSIPTNATFTLRTPEQALEHSALLELKEKLKNL
jgi:hypothetical protein